jgi:hypothetical protein
MEVQTAVSTGVSIVMPEVVPARVDELGCPHCGGVITATAVDYGVDSDTGYHDTGFRFTCLNCGAEGTEDELPL